MYREREPTIFETESLKRGIHTLNDVFSGQAAVVDRVLTICSAPVDL